MEHIHHALYVEARKRAVRKSGPTTAIIDSQSAKATQNGALRSTRRATTRPSRPRAASGAFLSRAWLDIQVRGPSGRNLGSRRRAACPRQAHETPLSLHRRHFTDGDYHGSRLARRARVRGRLRASSGPTSHVSTRCPSAESLSGPWPRSAAAGASCAVSSAMCARPLHSSASR